MGQFGGLQDMSQTAQSAMLDRCQTDAETFVRRVVRDVFAQEIEDEKVSEVARRVAQAVRL